MTSPADRGRYAPGEVLARGGQGRILRAIDGRLGREVAIKEPIDPAQAGRFAREALIIARLQHPAIIPVYDVGRGDDGVPFYAMKLVEGQSLQDAIAAARNVQERLALLPRAIAVAEAVAFAHSRRIVHRDLKPANVLVGAYGETVVIDWGLAKELGDAGGNDVDRGAAAGAAGERDGQTVAGTILGTPGYMAPEQARGEAVDVRADVYALGAMLYHLLAGAPPVSAMGTAPAMSTGAVDDDALDSRPSLPRDVPRDLAAIVLKAMSPETGDRYADAGELAADLRRFHTGLLVSAHAYTRRERVWRIVTRHRALVLVAMAAVVAVAALSVTFSIGILEERNTANAQRARAEAERAVAQTHRESAEARQRSLVLLQARAALARDPTAAIAWLKAYPPDAPDQGQLPPIADEAIASGVARHVWRERDWVYGATFSPDGRLIATASKDGDVRLLDVATGHRRIIGHHDGGVVRVEFSPDGGRVATGGLRGDVRLWNVAAGTLLRAFPGLPEQIDRLTFSPDGRRLLAQSLRRSAIDWDLETGAQGHRWSSNQAVAIAVASTDWTRLLAATRDGELLLVGVDRARRLAVLPGASVVALSHDGATGAVHDGERVFVVDLVRGRLRQVAAVRGRAFTMVFSPDDGQLAIGVDNGEIAVVDVHGGEGRVLRGHTDQVYGLTFTRDGQRLVSSSDDGTARIWDLARGVSRVLRGHDDDVSTVRLSPDETMVVTSSFDGSVRLWPLAATEAMTLRSDGRAMVAMQLVDDGRLVTVSDLRATRWDLDTGHGDDVCGGASVAAARLVAIAERGGQVALVHDENVVDICRDGTRQVVRGRDRRVTAADLSSDGTILFTGSSDGVVRRWELRTGSDRILIDESAFVGRLAVAPGGDRVVASIGPDVLLLDGDGDGTRRVRVVHATPDESCRLSGSLRVHGDRVSLGACDGSQAVWAADRGALTRLEYVGFWASSLTMSRDGSQVYGGMADRTIRVWSAESGALTATLRGHTDFVTSIALSPDGQRLASASYDRTIRIWNLASGESQVLRGHDASVDLVAWTRDGARVVSGGRDGTVRVWHVPPLDARSPSVVRARLSGLTTAVIDPDDRATTPSSAGE